MTYAAQLRHTPLPACSFHGSGIGGPEAVPRPTKTMKQCLAFTRQLACGVLYLPRGSDGNNTFEAAGGHPLASGGRDSGRAVLSAETNDVPCWPLRISMVMFATARVDVVCWTRTTASTESTCTHHKWGLRRCRSLNQGADLSAG